MFLKHSFQADTFENFVEEEESDGEERQVKEKNHRVIGTMDASESDSEVRIRED